jgi:hypothetical protein
LKFAHQIRILKPRDVISTFAPIMDCDGEKCAWWTKTQEQCAIRSINMALWALNEKLEKLPEELAGLSP